MVGSSLCLPAEQADARRAVVVQAFDARPTGMFVTAMVGNQMFGFPIGRVREIFYVDRIFSVPESPAHVAGLINLRGRIILLADLRTWLGLAPHSNPGDERLCIAIENGDEVDGVLVDDIGDILTLPFAASSVPPSGLDLRWAQISVAVHPLETGLMLEIEPGALFAGTKAMDKRPYLPAA